jgi:hypothetical protein
VVLTVHGASVDLNVTDLPPLTSTEEAESPAGAMIRDLTIEYLK